MGGGGRRRERRGARGVRRGGGLGRRRPPGRPAAPNPRRARARGRAGLTGNATVTHAAAGGHAAERCHTVVAQISCGGCGETGGGGALLPVVVSATWASLYGNGLPAAAAKPHVNAVSTQRCGEGWVPYGSFGNHWKPPKPAGGPKLLPNATDATRTSEGCSGSKLNGAANV
jgi:hypothetical protein